jgi:hypothetical protein
MAVSLVSSVDSRQTSLGVSRNQAKRGGMGHFFKKLPNVDGAFGNLRDVCRQLSNRNVNIAAATSGVCADDVMLSLAERPKEGST